MVICPCNILMERQYILVIYQVARGEILWKFSSTHLLQMLFINSSILKVNQLNFAVLIFLILNLKNV